MPITNRNNSLVWYNTLDNSNLKKGSVQAQGIFGSLKNKLTKMDIFGGLTIAAAAAFVKISQEAYKLSVDFDHAMREVATISEETRRNFEAMSDSIVEIGTEVPQSMLQLSEAFYQIASASYDGADGLKLLKVSARAAVAGVTDTKTAADGLTSALNAWKIEAKNADKVSDKFFTTVRLGKTTMKELSDNISTVAPLAAAMGVSIEGVLSPIATLTKGGTDTSVAFTQVRGVLIALNDVLGDGWSKTMTFNEAVLELYNRADRSQTKLKEMVGRIEGVNGVLGLVGENAKTAAEDFESLQNSTGATDKAFNEMMKSQKNQSALFKANMESMLKPLGDFIKVLSTDAIKSMNKFFKLITDGREKLIRYDDVLGEIVERNSKKFNEDLETQSARMKILFERIKKTNEGSEIRRDLLGQLNTQYSEYLPYLLTEKSTLVEIEAAQKAANINLREALEIKVQQVMVEEILTKQIKREAEYFTNLVDKHREHNLTIKQLKTAYEDFIKPVKEQTGEYDSLFKSMEAYPKVLFDITLAMGAAREQRRKDSLSIEELIELYGELHKVLPPPPDGDEPDGDEPDGDEGKGKYADLVREKKSLYEDYIKTKKAFDQEYADERYEGLLKEGETFETFLTNQYLKYKDNFDKTLVLIRNGLRVIEADIDKKIDIKIPNVLPKRDSPTLAPTTPYKEVDNTKEAMKAINHYSGSVVHNFEKMRGVISEINPKLSDTSSSMIDLIAAQAELAVGMLSGNPEAVISGIINYGVAIFNAFKKIDAGAESYEDRLNEINDLLNEQERIIEKSARSGGTNDAYKEKIELLNQQIALIKKAIKAEENREGSFLGLKWEKTDEDVVNSLQDELKGLGDEYEDTLTSLGDLLSGGITEMNIADQIAEAFSQGKTSVTDFAAFTNNILKDAVLEVFKSAVLGDTITEAKTYLESALGDKVLSDEEIQSFQDIMGGINSQAQTIADDLNFDSLFGNEADKGKGIAGKIKQSITEETASMIEGLLRGIAVEVNEQTEVLVQSNSLLNDIRVNTNSNVEYLPYLESINEKIGESFNQNRSTGIN